MKKDYEKPVLEVVAFDIEVKADGSGGQAEAFVGDWWD